MKTWENAKLVELSIDETAEVYKECDAFDGYIYDETGKKLGWKMGVEEGSGSHDDKLLDDYT